MPSEAPPEYHSPFIRGLHPKFSRETLRDSFAEDKEQETPSTRPLGIGSPRAPPSSARSSEETYQDQMEGEQLVENTMPSMTSNGNANGNGAPGEMSYAEAVLEDLNDKGVSPADQLLNRKTEFDDHHVQSTDPSTRDAHNKPPNGGYVEPAKDVEPYDGNHYSTATENTKVSQDTLEKKAEEYHGDQHSTSTEKLDSSEQILEKEVKEYDGNYLTSTKMPEGYEEALKKNKLEDPVLRGRTTQARKDKLESGRQAGEGWHTSAIRWAPLNIPLQRRLQTGMVLLHGLSIVGLLALFLFLCAIPLLWPILVPYLIYCLFSTASTSGRLSHRSEWLRRSKAWSLFASYYPARLHRCQELPPTRKYLFGYHPHGIIAHGAMAAFCTEALGFSQLFPGITNTLLTLDSNFRIPIYRDYALALGLASVSRESCENLLSRGGPNGEGMGRAITIVVGGARESLEGKPGSMKLVLKRRKGFIKLAIRNGADVVPVLGFGENDLYEQFQPDKHPFVHQAQMTIKKVLGFTVPLFHARGVFNYDIGLLPYRRPINVVVGRPIQVEQQAKPDDKYVDEVHQKYMDELIRLWDEHKNRFAPNRTGELEIVE